MKPYNSTEYKSYQVPLRTILKVNPLVRLLQGYEDINQIILFGSYARNQQTSQSDIDLLVIVHKDLEKSTYQYSSELMSHLTSNGVDLDVQILVRTDESLEANPILKHNLNREGVIIYERRNFGILRKSR